MNRLLQILAIIGSFLLYLITPEDTVEAISEGQVYMARQQAVNVRSRIKAVFWIGLSIVITLLIGQLK